MDVAGDFAPVTVRSKMSRLGAGAALPGRRSSIFDTDLPLFRPTGGSSFISGMAPHHDDLGDELPVKTAKVQYENTYVMDPPRRFEAHEAEYIIKEVMNSQLEDQKYDPMACSPLAKEVSTEIMDRLKDLKYDRYKLVCMVNIGEKKDQSIRCGSRCIWDATRDTWASAAFTNTEIYATAEVYALYYE